MVISGLEFKPYVCLFSGNPTSFGWDNKLHIWPWKFKVNVTTKVRYDGHISGLEFNRFVCFLFRGNRTIFGWDIANYIILTLKSQDQGHNENRPKSNQVHYRSGPSIFPKMKEIWKIRAYSEVIEWTKVWDRRRCTNRYRNIKSPRYVPESQWLNNFLTSGRRLRVKMGGRRQDAETRMPQNFHWQHCTTLLNAACQKVPHNMLGWPAKILGSQSQDINVNGIRLHVNMLINW